MAVNPVRPVQLLKEIRDVLLEIPDFDGDEAEDIGEDVAISLFRMLLQVDTLAGDTKARDRLQAQLTKARDEGREDDVAALERVLR